MSFGGDGGAQFEQLRAGTCAEHAAANLTKMHFRHGELFDGMRATWKLESRSGQRLRWRQAALRATVVASRQSSSLARGHLYRSGRAAKPAAAALDYAGQPMTKAVRRMGQPTHLCMAWGEAGTRLGSAAGRKAPGKKIKKRPGSASQSKSQYETASFAS